MRGVFIGLTTLDTVYLVDRVPAPDEKTIARDFTICAGGPATGAAVTFAYLGGRACLVSAIGSAPHAALVRADLARHRVRHVELAVEHPLAGSPVGAAAGGVAGAAAGGVIGGAVGGVAGPLAVPGGGSPAAGPAGSAGTRPAVPYPLPVSAVLVTAATGERAVVSGHAAAPPCPANTAAATAVADADVVVLDGHQAGAAIQLVRSLRDGGPPVLLDGGSWKAGTERLLPLVDIVICGAAFRPPDLHPREDVLDYLLARGPFFAAVTDGPGPIRWATAQERGYVLPPAVPARDTLGAGDVFHGAFAWMLARGAIATDELVAALGEAAGVAARSVQSFGPRAWMT